MTVTKFQIDGISYQFVEEDKCTVKELAEELECSQKTIYDMRKKGLPFCGRFCTREIARIWQLNNPNWRQR